MPNEQNLIPLDERTKSEQREIQRKGGIASGVARRRKRSLKEAADLYLSLPVTDRRRAKKLERRSVAPEDIDNQMAMIAGLWEAACEGSAQAATVLVKLLGEDAPANGAEEVPENNLFARMEEALNGLRSPEPEAADDAALVEGPGTERA